MPKYEIGYIISSAVSDDVVPNVAGEIAKKVEASSGKILNENHAGRKKLAYPIGRTRNGYYVFLTVDLPADKVKEVEHKLNTEEAVIRFIIVNQTLADKRKIRDEEIRSRRPVREPEPKEQIASDVDIEKEIEKAISEEKNV